MYPELENVETLEKENRVETDGIKVESYSEIRNSLISEMTDSVDDLKNKDSEIAVIEKSVHLKDTTFADKIKSEINLEEALDEVNSEADNLEKTTLSELTQAESFLGSIESHSEKIELVKNLFKNLDIEELANEDIESHAAGYNVTSNIKDLESLKDRIIEYISPNENSYNLKIGIISNFERLLPQKSFQDIAWIISSFEPEAIISFGGNRKFNAFIQERPEFLKSAEFRKIRLHQLKEGIENGRLFQGYIHHKEVQFPETKLDYFSDAKDSWTSFRFDDEKKKIYEDSTKKSKRISLGNDTNQYIVDIEQFENDITSIDSLNTEEKFELKNTFLKQISKAFFFHYNSEKVFAEEIFKVAEKLDVPKEEVNNIVYNAFINGIIAGIPPAHGIDKEFTEVNRRIEETLSDPNKRRNVLEPLLDNIRTEDKQYYKWGESYDYMNLTPDEGQEVKDCYIDFSKCKEYQYKLNTIFQYSWSEESDLSFSKEERTRAYKTMLLEQKSKLLETFDGNMEKLNYLPFSKEDVIEFGINKIGYHECLYTDGVAKTAQEKILRNFNTIEIEDKDIIKRAIIKNLLSIDEIESSLAKNDIGMYPSEIISQFNSPDDFVLMHIKGADRQRLKALEGFRNRPDAPPLPNLSMELYGEIRNKIISQKASFQEDHKNLKDLLSFIPKQYKHQIFSDKEMQEAFSNYYRKALEDNDDEFIHDLGFLIPKTEELNRNEHLVFEKFIEENNYYKLFDYYNTLFKNNPKSPSITEIENLFKNKLTSYGINTEELILNSNNIEKTVKDSCSNLLNSLTPENLKDEDQINELINIRHESSADGISRVYNIVKNVVDYKYFNDEIKDLLWKGVTEKFINTLHIEATSNPESIPKAVEFTKDIDEIFYDYNFLNENYDYLYKTFSKMDSEEYVEKMSLLKSLSYTLTSPLSPNIKFEELWKNLSSYSEKEQNEYFELVNVRSYVNDSFENQSWAKNTITYVSEAEDHGVLMSGPGRKEKIIDLYSGDYKNTALKEMSAEWKDFLSNSKLALPPQIRIISSVIEGAGGAGNLKHIESLGNLMSQTQSIFENSKTSIGTSLGLKALLSQMENRFTKEKWSQDDISEFYNISKDILEASPSLYTSFLPVFENISSTKSLKKFASDIFPFYQTQLVIQQTITGDSVTYNPRDLVIVRNSIKEFADELISSENEAQSFETEKLRLLEVAKDGFRDRFGLLNVPEGFTKENLRTIQNTIRYMGNISERSPKNESLISLYLGLELDNKWGDFRGGNAINFSEYLSEEKLNEIRPALEEKKKSLELLSEVSGVKMDNMSEFQNILQEDVSNNLIGDVQTIDVKLGNIKRNIDELLDPDIYQSQREKDILELLLDTGKNVNAALSKLYGISVGKKLQLSEEEIGIVSKIESLFEISNWTPEKVKNIQDEIQPIGLIVNMANKTKEENIEEKITELQKLLIPDNQIIEIFNKLGEEFHQESGALALSKDLSYLENIIVKSSTKLSLEETEAVTSYIGKIRDMMKGMENSLDQTKQYFEKIKKSSHLESNVSLKNRIREIEKVIYKEDANSIINSQMTKDLNLVIENMRQCLGCMRREVNNDTNLSFGDYNKFFMMNQSEKEKGSISDEIVFFVPITKPGGAKEMSFVMDQIYGSKSSDVLLGNVAAIYKKYQRIRKEFPESKVSITVTDAAMRSVGLDHEILSSKLNTILGKKLELEKVDDVSAFIPKSSLSDNYVEFGKDASARQTGERKLSCLIIK